MYVKFQCPLSKRNIWFVLFLPGTLCITYMCIRIRPHCNHFCSSNPFVRSVNYTQHSVHTGHNQNTKWCLLVRIYTSYYNHRVKTQHLAKIRIKIEIPQIIIYKNSDTNYKTMNIKIWLYNIYFQEISPWFHVNAPGSSKLD